MALLFDPLPLRCGLSARNRFFLAPLTNTQSGADGVLSEAEFRWLTMRAEGGFGLTMTCAAHVDRMGQGFPGQLGVWSDDHLPGLTRLAAAIRAAGSLAFVQLHHAGVRAPSELTGGQPVGPSAHESTGARAMSGAEVEALIEAFVAAAARSRTAGFDGVEIHGAHGYVLSSFLSPTMNRREDGWGGSAEKRARIVFEIIDGVRARCGAGFGLGLRISPERFGQKIDEARALAARAMGEGKLDFLDLSLWDFRKAPEEADHAHRPLMDWFTDLPRAGTALGAAGKILTGADAREALARGADFAVVGRGAILKADFPRACAADADYPGVATPVSPAYLADQGLSPAFVEYMRRWEGFVGAE